MRIITFRSGISGASSLPGQSRYHYLDMDPDTIVREGYNIIRNDRLHWSPARCFYKDDLYTLRFGPETTDVMERLFFGMVDRLAMSAVTEMAEFAGIGTLSGPDAFRNLQPYMGAQRFRTPRGLDDIKKISSWEDLTPFAEVYVSTQRFRLPPEFYQMRKIRSQLAPDDPRQILSVLMGVFQAYSTMWMEGVWEIVHARQSKTKFIVSDNPVTFYCKTTFPSDWLYPNDCNFRKQIGTRTCFRSVWIRASSSRICSWPGTPRLPRQGTGRTRATMARLSNTLARYSLAANPMRATLYCINYILKEACNPLWRRGRERVVVSRAACVHD